MPDILEYCKGRKVETFKSGATLIKQGGEDHKLFVLVEKVTGGAKKPATAPVIAGEHVVAAHGH